MDAHQFTYQHNDNWLHCWTFQIPFVPFGVVKAMNVHKGMLTRLYQALATLATIHTCLYLQELRGLELRNSIWEPSAWQHQHSHPQPAPLKHQLIHWTLQMWCSWLSPLLGMLGQLPTSIRTKEWEIGQKDILRMSNRTLESLLHEQESTTELPTSFLCVKFVFEKISKPSWGYNYVYYNDY